MKVVNMAEAELFLKLLSPNSTKFIFQTFDDSVLKRKGLVSTRVGKIGTFKDSLIGLNARGAGVFVTVNESNSNRRIKRDMVSARAIWQEDDIGTDKIPELAPSLVVETSEGKYHRYWFIRGGTDDLDSWEKVQQSLVDNWDSDPNVKDTCRVMRLPGFYHNKREDKEFRTKIISDTNDVKYYRFSELQGYFAPAKAKTSEKQPEPDTFDTISCLQEVLSSDNYHGALQSLAGHYANMSMSADEVTLLLKSLIFSSKCDDNMRRQRALEEVESQVKWAFKETEKENYVHPELKNVNEVYEKKVTDQYLSLTPPPCAIKELIENINSHMRYPSYEIAVEAALHIVNVFAGSYYNYEGVPNHRRTVLLAPQGRGKNVVYQYTSKLVSLLHEHNKFDMMYLDFIGNGDYTSPKQMHLELQDFGSRSMISSEAGHTQATTAGDRAGLRGYENQTVTCSPEVLISPPRKQNSTKGENQMSPIRSICMSILHESVLENYAKLFADRSAFTDGTVSRTSFIFINPHIGKINSVHTTAKIPARVFEKLQILAKQYVTKGDPKHANLGQYCSNPVNSTEEVKRHLSNLEQIYINKRNNDETEVVQALFCRKILLIKQCCRQLAVYENPTNPIITLDMLNWSIHRSDNITNNMMYHATIGSFSSAIHQCIIESKYWIKRYIKGKLLIKPHKMEVKRVSINGTILRRKFFNPQHKLHNQLRAEPMYKYKTTAELYNVLIDELETEGLVRVLWDRDMFGNMYARKTTARDLKIMFSTDLRS